MKYGARRRHVARPDDYEGVTLEAWVEIDTEVDTEFAGLNEKEIGDEFSEMLDNLLETDVTRTLRLDGQHVENMHLWSFYEMG